MTLALKLADARYDGFDEGFAEGREQGLEQGAHQKALETAKTFLSMGLSPEQVAQGTNLPLNLVQELL